MKWTTEQVEKLRALCRVDTPNADIAAAIGCTLNDIYSKRTALGITRPKLGFTNAKRNYGVTTIADTVGADTIRPPLGHPPRIIPRSVENAIRVLHITISRERASNAEIGRLNEAIAKLVKKYEEGGKL